MTVRKLLHVVAALAAAAAAATGIAVSVTSDNLLSTDLQFTHGHYAWTVLRYHSYSKFFCACLKNSPF